MAGTRVRAKPGQGKAHGSPVFSFRAGIPHRLTFQRMQAEIESEGTTIAAYLARALEAYWKARTAEVSPGAPVRPLSPIPFLEAVDLGARFQDILSAFAEGREDTLDEGAYRDWARRSPLAVTYLRQWAAQESCGPAFAIWWQDRVESLEDEDAPAALEGGRTG